MEAHRKPTLGGLNHGRSDRRDAGFPEARSPARSLKPTSDADRELLRKAVQKAAPRSAMTRLFGNESATIEPETQRVACAGV